MSAEDCAKLLKSFADADMFDVDLMHALERLFVEKMAFASGPQMVLVFEAHADWAENVIRETVIDKE